MVITFDLPRWLKASRLVFEKGMPVIVRLAGFHTMNSFLGCVGYIMAHSGLEDLMRLVYSGDATQIMDGGSYYKALRAHFLLDFIRAERLHDFDLHLAIVAKMLPIFATAGRGKYSKALRLSLEQ